MEDWQIFCGKLVRKGRGARSAPGETALVSCLLRRVRPVRRKPLRFWVDSESQGEDITRLSFCSRFTKLFGHVLKK